jgi:septum site-determining protein MinC
MSSAIGIKGTRDGLLLTLGAGKIEQLLAELQSLIAKQESFFRGGEVMLQFNEAKLASRDVARTMEMLDQYGVSVRAILAKGSDLSSIEASVEASTEEDGTSASRIEPPTQSPSQGLDASEGILVKRTLRSGQSVTYAGHVVVVGDVNSGAEVVAEGDIVVWGRLRGIVHAGAAGDETRSICALALAATQLRIGNRIARSPEGKKGRKKFGPERAFISEDQIVAEEWR